eukprot:COSAG02_NODE_8549_length_2527_cov_1.095513_3_plen_183_part_00
MSAIHHSCSILVCRAASILISTELHAPHSFVFITGQRTERKPAHYNARHDQEHEARQCRHLIRTQQDREAKDGLQSTSKRHIAEQTAICTALVHGVSGHAFAVCCLCKAITAGWAVGLLTRTEQTSSVHPAPTIIVKRSPPPNARSGPPLRLYRAGRCWGSSSSMLPCIFECLQLHWLLELV